MLSVSPSAKRLSRLGKWGKRSLQLLEVLIAGGNALLFTAKTHCCWEITFTADSISSECSIDSRSSDNDSDSDLTVTSELAQPLAK
jgi:hypothetical protein